MFVIPSNFGVVSRTVMALCLSLLASCSNEAPLKSDAPDMILINGRVSTMDSNESIVEAIAIHGETIVATGLSMDIRALAGADTEVIDLNGRTVTPGLIDTHNHFA